MNNSTRSGVHHRRRRSWRKVLSTISAVAIAAAGVHVVQSGYLPSAFADPTTSPVEHGDKYATGVTITGTAPHSIPFNPARDLKDGEKFTFSFNWEVGQKERPKPGDTMTITLPEWMLSVTTNESLDDANGYTTCVVRALNTTVKCTFKDAVVGANQNNLRGAFQAELTAQGGKQSTPIRWGQEINAYKQITGQENGTVVEPKIVGEKIPTSEATKNGVVASEFKYQGQTYLQVLWTVILPTEVMKGTITLSDELQSLTLTDPDSGEQITLPQYLSAGDVGGAGLALMRRDNPTEEGAWANSESVDCQPGGKYARSNLDCAKLVAYADSNTGAITPVTRNLSGESFSTTGVPGRNNWEKNTSFNLTLENPKKDSVYRLTFYTWIPKHPAIKLNQGDKNPPLNNTVEFNGQKASGTASIHAKFYSEAFGDPTKTRVIVRKKVEGPANVTSDVEQFPITLTPAAGEGQECPVSPTQECYFDIPAGSAATISEAAVQNSQYKWRPGVFTLGPRQTGKNTQYEINDNGLNITRAHGGEAIVFTLTNTFTAPPPAPTTGKFRVRKTVIKPDALNLAQNFNFTYRCVSDTATNPIEGTFTIPVAGGDHASDSIPAGYECTINEQTAATKAEAEAKHHVHAVNEESKTVTIEAGQDKQVDFTNTYTPVPTGYLSVQKNARGLSNGATLQTVNVSFTCNRESKSQGDQHFEANTPKVVPVAVGGQAQRVGEFYVGTVCTFDEVENSAKVADHTGPEISYTPGTQRIEIGEGESESNAVIITNAYTPVNFGVLKVKKVATVAGADPAAALPAEIPANVTVKLRCDKPSRNGKYQANTEFSVQVPQNGEASVDEDFAHGTRCEYVDEQGAVHTNYDLEAHASQPVTIGADADANRITVTNTYTPKTATFTVVKNVDKPAGLNLTKPFRFSYTCTVGASEETGVLEISATGGQKESKPFAVGTKCTITEQVDETAAEAKAANHIHSVDEVTKQVTIAVDRPARAEFTNTYTPEEKGTLFVAKEVLGLADGATVESVSVAVTCNRDSVSTGDKQFRAGEPKNVTVATRLAAVEVGEFFAGTECSFEEIADSAKVRNHHDPAVTYAPENKSVTIKPGNQPGGNIMRITNTYTPEEKGTLFVAKEVRGLAAGARLESVDVKVTCDRDSASTGDKAFVKDVEKTISVATKAAAVEVGEFFAGTTCRFVEDATSAGVENHVAPTVSYEPTSQSVQVQPGARPDLNIMRITNTYTENPKGVLFVKKEAVNVAQGATAPQVTVDVRCTAPLVGETENFTGDFKLKPGAEPAQIGEFYAGASCTVTERAETAKLDEHQGPVVSYQPAGGQITLQPGTTAEENLVTVTNTYTEVLFGALRLKKNAVVNGVAGAQLPQSAPATVTAQVTCDKDSRKGKYPKNKPFDVTVTQNGAETVVDEEFEYGTVCSVSQELGASADAYTPAVQVDRAVTIGAQAADNLITITNTYNPQQGSFTVIKKVVDNAKVLPEGSSFSFDYKCVHPQFPELNKEGTLTIQGAGHAVVADVAQGSTCTVTEKDASLEHVSWKVQSDKPDATITLEPGAPATLTFTNTYTVPTGALSVTKQVVREDADGVGKSIALDKDKEYTFTYTCELPAATAPGARANLGEPSRGELKVKAGGTNSVTGIVAGSRCHVQEVAESAQVENAAVTLPRPQDTVLNQVGISQLSFTNTYAARTGVVKVNKVLEGSAKDLPKVQDYAFDMRLTCTKQEWVLNKEVKVSANTPVEVAGIPAGAQCAVTEDLARAKIPGVRVDTDPQSVINVAVPAVAADTVAEVSVRNTVTELGRVQLTKTLAGLSANQGEGEEFKVTVTWQDNGEHKQVLSVKPGEPVLLPEVPVGTVVHLVEAKPEDTAFAAWADPEFFLGDNPVTDAEGRGVVTVASGSFDAPAALELRNTANPPWWWIFVGLIPLVGLIIPRVIPAAPQPPAQAGSPVERTPGAPAKKGVAKSPQRSEPALADTGADVRLWFVLSLLLIAAGGALALRRRNS